MTTLAHIGDLAPDPSFRIQTMRRTETLRPVNVREDLLADDKTQPLILEALEHSIREPAGLPLHGKGGLFPSGAAGKQAAQACLAQGWLQSVRTETKGKAKVEHFTLSESGLAHLLERTSARPILESLLEAIQRCQSRIHDWIDSVQKSQGYLDSLRSTAYRILEQMQ